MNKGLGMCVRVVLADDHKIVREGLCSLLRNDPRMEIVGVAEDGRSGVQLVQEQKPGVVVMDVTMPDLNGIDRRAPRHCERSDAISCRQGYGGHERSVGVAGARWPWSLRSLAMTR